MIIFSCVSDADLVASIGTHLRDWHMKLLRLNSVIIIATAAYMCAASVQLNQVSAKVDGIFYANGYGMEPLRKLSVNGSGIYVLEVTVENKSDLAIFVLPEYLATESRRVDLAYRFDNLVPNHVSMQEPTMGVDFDFDTWVPLSSQSPFARIEAHSKRTILVFSENRLSPKVKSRSQNDTPTSISLSAFSEEQREKVRAQYSRPATMDPFKAFTNLLDQINLIPKGEPRTIIDVPLDKASWSNGKKQGEANGYYFHSG